eukprot:SM000240S08623  [mRNA]  locus=s240:31859:34079:- [translate_table: standard]
MAAAPPPLWPAAPRRASLAPWPAPGQFEEGELERPRWTGDEPLSRAVNALMRVRPLFALLKLAARRVLIQTAEKNGVPWREMAARTLADPALRAEKELVEDKSFAYPDYYLQEFHAYKDGNLCWEAAAEVEAATLSMCRRAIPTAATVGEAVEMLRGGWLGATQAHHQRHSGGFPVKAVLDIGCATGASTRYLATAFLGAHVTGLDLSPYFLAVAQLREKREAVAEGRQPIRWLHAKGEATSLPSASYDIITLSFVIHECPSAATLSLLEEAKRLLRRGGTLAITDNSPKSKIIQNLPPVLFTLMKSTEPYTDQYYQLDLEEAMRAVGFSNVHSVLSDPRHRTVTGTA